jgi:ribosomal protein L37E
METKKQQEKKIQYIICRVCGYIETADKADQPCPACGYPKTVWMEYNPRRLNPTRKKLLDLHCRTFPDYRFGRYLVGAVDCLSSTLRFIVSFVRCGNFDCYDYASFVINRCS